MKTAPDALVVGSGPNGLAAAITLARAGRSVRVLEGQPTVGGGVRSAERTLPGFVHDLGSAIHPLGLGSPFFKTLPLERHGLRWIQPEVAVAHPFDDGTAAALYPSLERTCDSLGADGRRYGKLMGPFVRRWEALSEEFLQPMLHFPKHPFLLARFGLAGLQPAAFLARRLFRGEHARGLFAGLAAHSFLSLDAPGSAAFGLVLGAAGHALGWPMPEGGAQRLSDALAGVLRELGGGIETSHPVREIRALPDVRATLLDLGARQAADVARDVLPASYRRKLARFPPGPGVFKMDYALDAPVPWTADACRRAGTVHLGGSLEDVAASERAMARGELAARPFVLLAQHTLFDPTRAPSGKHTLWAYCHVPPGCAEDRAAAIEAQIERFAPGFGKTILARHASGPARLETENANLAGGDISGGSNTLWRLLARPVLSLDPYRMGARGLYLCSSSTPPGGGVHGMCGHLAARAALGRELK